MSVFVPIDERILRALLHESPLKAAVNFHIFEEIGSTNTYLKTLKSSPLHMEVCCAEKQSAGRGRFGRHWDSPFGENLYLSLRLRIPAPLSRLSSLALVVALSIRQSLESREMLEREPVLIKWPNDLLWQDKKLCGILIETALETNHFCELIIGIGLNVNMDTQRLSPDKNYASLYAMRGALQDRNLLIIDILHSFEVYLEKFLNDGFKAFQAEWQAADYLRGKTIKLMHAQKALVGLAHGVNAEGQLCLIDEQGHTHYLSSGEASLSALTKPLS